ncbi:MAG: ArsA-related P-loop ATPase [Thermoanaerobaculia bacterium]|nr:ArsA-related P-loop ATPase [Thermoanaerobaculia bacterium]
MRFRDPDPPLIVVVGSGGVGKTTLGAALGVVSAEAGHDTLVMTFDPSHRLKDTLGVGEEAKERDVEVMAGTEGRLSAGLLDPRRTFDRLVARYAPDEEARDRILENRYYDQLAGSLAGILEYMAVEKLYEAHREGGYRRILLDTPPTRQALDFLEAPSRIVGFLESGALRIALKPWFDEEGKLQAGPSWGFLRGRLERWLDEIVGLDLLRDMAEFFRAFGPLFDGFRQRAREVETLLRSEKTRFLLVAGPNEERIPDTLFFARKLREAQYHLGPVVVNRIHPRVSECPEATSGRRLLSWEGEQDHRGLEQLRELLPEEQLVTVPFLSREPTDLESLGELGAGIEEALTRFSASEKGGS